MSLSVKHDNDVRLPVSPHKRIQCASPTASSKVPRTSTILSPALRFLFPNTFTSQSMLGKQWIAYDSYTDFGSTRKNDRAAWRT